LYAHFNNSAVDNSLDSKERAQYNGLASKLACSNFLQNLALMCDALQELSDLSEALQAESMNVPKADHLIRRQIFQLHQKKMFF